MHAVGAEGASEGMSLGESLGRSLGTSLGGSDVAASSREGVFSPLAPPLPPFDNWRSRATEKDAEERIAREMKGRKWEVFMVLIKHGEEEDAGRVVSVESVC